MLKYFGILFLLLISSTAYSQFEYFTIDTTNYEVYQLNGLAEHLNLKNQRLVFGYNSSEDTLVIASVQEQNTVVLGHAINEYFFNAAKMYSEPYWSNDTVYIKSEMPFRATVWTLKFVWNKNIEGFTFLEPDYYDPSSLAVEKGDSLLATGNIREAIHQYYGVMYPSAYMNEANTGMQIMEKCHEVAMKYYKENNLDSAISIMELGLYYYPNSNYLDAKSKTDYDTRREEDRYNMVWEKDKTQLWLGDYGLFLYRNKNYEKSVEINKYINMILPELAGPYLQLGDSYYDTGNKKMAKETYQKYIALKKSQKKEKEIPKRVKERVK